ncbi:MAG: RES domain-containing protein [Waterburya sp.]
MLSYLIEPWSGEAYRHLPDGNYDVYDCSYTGMAANNRWNTQGEQTLYLAGSVDVAAGEWSRHFLFDRPKQLAAKTKRRKVYQMTVKLNHTLNLCDRLGWQELSLKDAPNCFLDKKVARATAQFIRQTTIVEAIFVPSMAFLDQMDKWVLVVFLEKLPMDKPLEFLPRVEDYGYLNVEI